jgi:adenylate cyclase
MKENKEIERKFLVNPEVFDAGGSRLMIKQGYLSVDPQRIVRIRREGEKAWITIKGKMEGITRPEFEYDVPVDDAEELLKLALFTPVEKIRHRIKVENSEWEVDEFLGENEGLWLAEIELDDENQPFSHPDWLGEEVTSDKRYYNNELSITPFSRWKTIEK